MTTSTVGAALRRPGLRVGLDGIQPRSYHR
jgi:hypothetical protein